MTFGAPQWFWGFLLVPALSGLFLANEARRGRMLGKLVARRLLPDLAASTSALRRRWKFTLALLGVALVNLALTEPRAGYVIIETHRHGLDLMVAMDTSRSMLSTDVQPDRLTRAKFAAQDLIESLEGDHVGMIAFAGTPFVEAPLTIDYSAVLASIEDLDTNTIPRGGTNIASAIRQAEDAFGKGEGSHRALVLFTDGEELEDSAVQAAKDVNGKFRIFTVGVGTPAGSLIPAPRPDGGTDFVRDETGQFVKSRLDEEKLKEIANATGGFYVHLGGGPETARAIIDQGLKKMQEHEFESHESRPIERYEWPLGAGILLLIASVLIRERRRVQPVRKNRVEPAAAAALALLLAIMAPARGWSMNEGLNHYDQKDYKGAYDIFQQQLQRNPASDGLEFDRGASAYKKGDYDKALEAFGHVLGSKEQGLRGQAEYNLANTLVQRGALQEQKEQKIKEWTDALKHYDQALKVDPNNADAKYNSDVVQKMIDELNKKPPPQQQQNQQQQNQQQQNQQQQNQQQQNQQQQNQQQQNQQQQNQQQQNQQQQNQQQQNQQQQNQQQQNQQQQQQNQQQQNQQQQNQQQQNQQQQNQQQQQDQQQGGSQNQQQQNQGQTGQQKQDEQNPSSGNQTQNMNAPSPSPTPGNEQGTLKENSQPDQQSEAKAAARAATEHGRAGEMTPSQAQALIDSMRDEDEHVNLYDRTQNNSEPVYKDW